MRRGRPWIQGFNAHHEWLYFAVYMYSDVPCPIELYARPPRARADVQDAVKRQGASTRRGARDQRSAFPAHRAVLLSVSLLSSI